ncbi:transposase, partial [Trichonephila clavipes]
RPIEEDFDARLVNKTIEDEEQCRECFEPNSEKKTSGDIEQCRECFEPNSEKKTSGDIDPIEEDFDARLVNKTIEDEEQCRECFEPNSEKKTSGDIDPIEEDFDARLVNKTIEDEYVTMDETWIHYYALESKRLSVWWTAAEESCPKHPRTQTSAGTAIVSLFWNAHEVLLIDYFEEGETISSEYYMTLLAQLNEKIKEKRSQLQKKKVLFHQDNAPCHKSKESVLIS